MRTIFNEIVDDWCRVKNHCRTTVRKEFTSKEPTETFKRKLLMAEHSPIRLLEFDWTWKDIPYWVSTEWSRHKFEKFISSQRNDRQADYDRNSARQDAPVRFDGYANMQSLIDAWRKRLCHQATREARELAEDFKRELRAQGHIEANYLCPNCIYRCQCPETQTCGYFDGFLRYVKAKYGDIEILFDGDARYAVYNDYFYRGGDQ